jgi:hypothetical protein
MPERLNCVRWPRRAGEKPSPAARGASGMTSCQPKKKNTTPMKTMWAPWRIEYILADKQDGCVFCKALSVQDDLTLFKGRQTMVVMNKYPYINGHLLVAPVRHVSALHELGQDEMGQLLSTVERSIGVLKKVMRPEGRRGRDRRAPAFSHRPALVGRHQRPGRVRRRACHPPASPGDVQQPETAL